MFFFSEGRLLGNEKRQDVLLPGRAVQFVVKQRSYVASDLYRTLSFQRSLKPFAVKSLLTSSGALVHAFWLYLFK